MALSYWEDIVETDKKIVSESGKYNNSRVSCQIRKEKVSLDILL